jgi:hypothetical protein
MARMVRAVSDGDRKYAGFDFKGIRRVNGEVFEWPDGRGMPEVRRDADGLIIGGWVELVSGEDGGAPPQEKGGRKRDKIPGLVGPKVAKYAANGSDLAGTRKSDRVVG